MVRYHALDSDDVGESCMANPGKTNTLTDVEGLLVGHYSSLEAASGVTVILCPDGAEFCSPEIGSWPHSALLCRVKKEVRESS